MKGEPYKPKIKNSINILDKFDVQRMLEAQLPKNVQTKRKLTVTVSANQDSTLKLPVKLDRNAIQRSDDSKVPDPNVETKVKKAMIKAFSNNNTLQ